MGCKLQKVGSHTLWTSSHALISKVFFFFFLTNSECFRSRAFTQRKETGIAVNLSQLLCCPPLHLQKQGEAALAKEHLAAVKIHPPWAGAVGPFLEPHPPRLENHSSHPATPSPNNDMVCVVRSLHPSPVHSYTTETLCPRGHRSSHLTVYKGQDAVGR